MICKYINELLNKRTLNTIQTPVFPACSDAVDSVTSLYNHMEEQAHVLVQRSNLSLEHLEYLLQLREMEGHFTQVLYMIPNISQMCVQIFRCECNILSKKIRV